MVRTSLSNPLPSKALGTTRGPRSLARMIAWSAAIAGVAFASSAMAASDMSTRLVRCGAESCLLVTGHRDDPASIVSINGRRVSVEGDYGWRVSVPLDTVRQWSAPYAREIEVSLRAPGTRRATTDSVALPIGVLGNTTTLASLEISIN